MRIDQLDLSKKWILVVCSLLLVIGVLGIYVAKKELFLSYLVAHQYLTTLALGALFFELLSHVTKARWLESMAIRCALLSKAIYPLFILFVPLLFMVSDIFPWAHHGHESPHGIVDGTTASEIYLQRPFMLTRGVIIYLCWFLIKWRVDQTTFKHHKKSRPLGAFGLIFLFFSSSFFFVDWIMSLEPHWASSGHPLVVLVGSFLVALCSTIVLEPSHRPNLSPRDLGNILLAAVMVWTYLTFAEYLIIWSGNKPHEVAWYLRRIQGPLQLMVIFMVVSKFLIPFPVLLVRKLKVKRDVLLYLCGLIFMGHFIEMCWYILPAGPKTWHYLWTLPLCVGLLGLIWLTWTNHIFKKVERQR